MIDLSRYSPAAQVLALKLTGEVGPRTFELLLTQFKTVTAIIAAEADQLLEIHGIGPKRSEAISAAADNLDKAQSIIDNLGAFDAAAVTSLDDDYPASLHELNDPPPLLFYRGRLPRNDEKRVAIVGSQDVSADGIGDIVELSSRLVSSGVAVIGGLARGIDTAGHIGAMKADGVSFGVLPCGIGQVHPSENAELATQLLNRGGLISEYVPNAPVSAGRLLARNRLIVGLSQAVVIGEVSAESVGTLDAALCCHQLGKLLFVVIGEKNPHYEKLAQYGAIPLTSIDDSDMILKSLV
jgi:DNA processing protein